MMEEKIHTTIGVYNNGDMKINGVKHENLADHVEYNKSYRPGRAFFVDGICVNRGYLTEERIKEYEKLFNNNPPSYTMSKDTAPYV